MKSSPLLRKPSFSKINQLATLLPTPADYYQGIRGSRRIQPENILCFARNKNSELRGRDSRQRDQHHRCVLVIGLKGSGRVCVDSKSFLLEEGQAQLIFPFQFHSYMEVQPAKVCWVFVTFESVSLSELASMRSSPSRSLGPTEMVLLRELMQCWVEEDRRELLSLHLGLLLGRLCAVDPARKNSSAPAIGNDTHLLTRVNRYILSRLDQPFGLKQMAKAVGQSESHLRARFRSATGFSIGRHIRHLRIQLACNLLHTTDQSISEVGENCGFDSVYSFSRTFKMEQGLSPREYRRKLFR